MHILGPLPKGQKLLCSSLYSGEFLAKSHRSGFQPPGSGNTDGSMWTLAGWADTKVYE